MQPNKLPDRGVKVTDKAMSDGQWNEKARILLAHFLTEWDYGVIKIRPQITNEKADMIRKLLLIKPSKANQAEDADVMMLFLDHGLSKLNERQIGEIKKEMQAKWGLQLVKIKYKEE